MKNLLHKLFRFVRTCEQILRRTPTSYTDNKMYRDFCMQASNDEQTFKNFRRNPVYLEILEHVSQLQGQQYLDEILTFKKISENIIKFKENDHWGNPAMMEYRQTGSIAPTTLRYIKVLCDLEKHFGSLNKFNICEIGVGYGGQCRIINSYFTPSRYTLVDLKPALMLAQKYLNKYTITSEIVYNETRELPPQNYDLVISNYAFTELTRKVQDVYLKRVILKSQRGYITYNEITPPEFHTYKKEELIRIISGSRIIEEKPLSHPKNCIIIWG